MTRAFAIALGVLLLGCKNDRPPAPAFSNDGAPSTSIAASASAPVASASASPREAGAEVPLGPVVEMLESDDYFPTRGFPAVSDDGKLVVFADRLADGGRGNPNLVVSIRKVADDTEAWSLVVLSADEWEKRSGGDGGKKAELTRAMKERIDKVGAKLRATSWRPLPLGDPRPDATTACREKTSLQRAEIGGVEVALDGTKLRMRPPAPAVAFEREVAGWSAKVAKPECKARNVMRLDRLYADVARAVVVVRIVYCGDDTCWEPEAQWHVLPIR